MKRPYTKLVTTTYLLKLLIIADKNVGRNTLLKETLKDIENLGVDFSNTVGVDFHKKKINVEEGTVVFQIWKVSKGILFKNHPRAYIIGSHAAILMFDLTNINSLKYLDDFPQLIRQYAGEIPILLVGNKSDLTEERTISKEQGIRFSKINNMLDYIEISAKTGQNCERIFNVLAEYRITQLDQL